MPPTAFTRHYEQVADASPVPVLVYNVTIFTGVTVPADVVARLSRHDQIAGLKDSSSDLAQLAEFIAASAERAVVLAGSAPTPYPSLCIGARGAVLAVAG